MGKDKIALWNLKLFYCNIFLLIKIDSIQSLKIIKQIFLTCFRLLFFRLFYGDGRKKKNHVFIKIKFHQFAKFVF